MILRLTLRRVGLGLAALALGGLLVGWSGVIYVGASGGHWAATEWFLHWVMRNSVRTRALALEAPDLSHPALLDRGAGHYATGCAPCHGAPGERQNPIVQASLPPPPEFTRRFDEWTPEELFRIVQHGVRYSGMPAWVAIERHDEIWAMVAFLEALPEMTPEEYRRLAFGPGGARQPSSGLIGIDAINTGGPAPPMQEALADCARCHGMDGRGRDNDAFPILAGQSEAYLRETLLAFSHGTRHSGMMQPPAARADDAVLGEIAGHYARQPRPPVAAPAEPALLAEGERIARQGIPAEGVPACLSCHGGAALARNPSYPALHGQHASYLENQLVQWQAGTRGGGPYRALMQTIAGRLTPEQNKAVAAWFAAQDAARD